MMIKKELDEKTKNKLLEIKDNLFDVIEEIDEAIGYQSDNEEEEEEEEEEENYYINFVIYKIIYFKRNFNYRNHLLLLEILYNYQAIHNLWFL